MSAGPISHLARLVEAAPDAVALWEGHCEPPAPVTRVDLWQRSVAVRDDLRDHGVGPGDCVAVWLPNWSDAVVWQFAAAALGAHVIGVNTRYGVDEVAHVLAKARPRVIAVAHGFLRLELATVLHAATESVDAPAPSVALVTGPGSAPADAQALAAYDVGAGAWAPSPAAGGVTDPGALVDHPDDLFVAFTTSGSTGRPKLAAHRACATAGHSLAVAAAADLDAGSVSLLVLPWSGVLAHSPGMAGLLAGGSLLLMPSFDADRALDLMERFAVTHLTVADDVAGRLMRSWRERPRDLTAFRRLLIGDFYGESGRIAAWVESETGATVLGIYGSSEIFALTGFWSPDTPLPLRHRGGGRLVTPGMEVRSVDPVTGELADGPGELQFRGPNVVDSYLGDVDGGIAAGVRSRDGWFCTGDLGTAAGDGTFEYLCRMGDSLRLKGFLVEPAEIETRLIEHEAVELVKVVGLDVTGETQAVAFVVPRPGTTPDPAELRAWCAETLARFKVPAQVHLIDEMPMTAGTNGAKIRAVALREMAKELASAGTEGTS
ncbi:AMP-binding protein [Nocardioides sp. Root151]|uniref:AMP-binding protein n=1 Tax=Nocardioides sp. Root151 TaxID=1736475 RepID=UPI000A9F15B7|nr:AMP-binding protein [Nocardioides sp. Root151]